MVKVLEKGLAAHEQKGRGKGSSTMQFDNFIVLSTYTYTIRVGSNSCINDLLYKTVDSEDKFVQKMGNGRQSALVDARQPCNDTQTIVAVFCIIYREIVVGFGSMFG